MSILWRKRESFCIPKSDGKETIYDVEGVFDKINLKSFKENGLDGVSQPTKEMKATVYELYDYLRIDHIYRRMGAERGWPLGYEDLGMTVSQVIEFIRENNKEYVYALGAVNYFLIRTDRIGLKILTTQSDFETGIFELSAKYILKDHSISPERTPHFITAGNPF